MSRFPLATGINTTTTVIVLVTSRLHSLTRVPAEETAQASANACLQQNTKGVVADGIVVDRHRAVGVIYAAAPGNIAVSIIGLCK